MNQLRVKNIHRKIFHLPRKNARKKFFKKFTKIKLVMKNSIKNWLRKLHFMKRKKLLRKKKLKLMFLRTRKELLIENRNWGIF